MRRMKLGFRGFVWRWLIERNWQALAYWWYFTFISSFTKLECKVCNRTTRHVTGSVTHFEKEVRGKGDNTFTCYRGGVLCRRCHKRYCGERHKRRENGYELLACAADLED